MDAAIMDGKTLDAGAVAFVKNVKNPIKLARFVMTESEHVMLAGEGVLDFAHQMNAEFADDEYFFTEHRYRQLQDAIEAGRIQFDHAEEKFHISSSKFQTSPKSGILNLESGITPKSLGTVGAVACDANGNLAAATSTGGMTNKKFGRIGDTPIIGAGTYADDATCAVSCTGYGEFFMRAVTAYDIAARMKYAAVPLEEAAGEAILRLTEIGGEGGLIAVDAQGNLALPFNSEGMYRGFITVADKPVIQIYK
jgi:beta-aspartyl-peptidase (threonine type)